MNDRLLKSSRNVPEHNSDCEIFLDSENEGEVYVPHRLERFGSGNENNEVDDLLQLLQLSLLHL